MDDDFYREAAPFLSTYDTQLTPEEQADYSTKYSPEDSNDYDMQGYYKDNPDVGPNTDGAHYPDTYKKPNHPTFSDESKYHGMNGNEGGTWGKAGDEDTFTPGPTNVKTHGLLGLIDYFDNREPDVRLMMPRSSNANR